MSTAYTFVVFPYLPLATVAHISSLSMKEFFRWGSSVFSNSTKLLSESIHTLQSALLHLGMYV